MRFGHHFAGDLAATMALNPSLKVLSLNGYFDSVTPFHQTRRDLDNMPLAKDVRDRNLTIKNYPSGHMIYLDESARTQMKADLADFYDSTIAEFKDPRKAAFVTKRLEQQLWTWSPSRTAGIPRDLGLDMFGAKRGKPPIVTPIPERGPPVHPLRDRS